MKKTLLDEAFALTAAQERDGVENRLRELSDAEFATMRAELADFQEARPTLVLAQTEHDCKTFKADAVDLAKAVWENREFIDMPIVEAARALIARAGAV